MKFQIALWFNWFNLILHRRNRVPQEKLKKKVPFPCTCNQCKFKGAVTGEGLNTEVFCHTLGGYRYATSTVHGCGHAVQA